MARVEFNPDQPIQALSGTMGKITYRTLNGKTFAHVRRLPELKKNASCEERAAYRERVMVDECVRIIQNEMEDFVAAMQARPSIRAAMKRYYRLHYWEFSSWKKLQRAMLSAYRSRKHRHSTVEVPM